MLHAASFQLQDAVRCRLNELFVHFLTLPETGKFIDGLVVGLRSGDMPVLRADLEPPLHSILTPPKSPKHSPVSRTASVPIPVLPSRRRPLDAFEVQAESKALQTLGAGLSMPDFCRFCKDHLHLPFYLSSVLYESVYQPGEMATFFAQRLAPYPIIGRVYQIFNSCAPGVPGLAPSSRDGLSGKSFEPFLWNLTRLHPALEFLKNTPEFQERYVQTVVIRIFYAFNCRSAALCEREFSSTKLVDFLAVLHQLDQQSDINAVLKIFSYEHFYVLYCRFWELDGDHDLKISREELARYSNYSLTPRCVTQVVRQNYLARQQRENGGGHVLRISSVAEDEMTYEDFVWFCMSEEDKSSTQTSLEYWFRVVDIDGDGFITAFEMQYFYSEQKSRMEIFNQEVVQFEDIYCQLIDMTKPKNDAAIGLSDFRKKEVRPLVPLFFNTLFNLNKFIAWEQRDPFGGADKANELTDWDKFARAEYDRMSYEEEMAEAANNVDEVLSSWD